MITIKPLDKTPSQIALIAHWIWREFWQHHPNGLSEIQLQELLSQVSDKHIPMAWVAWQGDQPVGCVNLIENDDDSRPHLRPWLAALLVLPEYRNKKVGAKLVQTVIEQAGQLQEPSLYLGTSIPQFYTALGANIIESEDRGEHPTHYVLKFDLCSKDF